MKNIFIGILLSTVFSLTAQAFEVSNTVPKDNVPSEDIHQRRYRVGNRYQRVRFLSANRAVLQKIHTNPDDQSANMFQDPVKSGELYGLLGAVTIGGQEMGLNTFDLFYAGMVVNPRAIECASKQLQQIEYVGDMYPEIFAEWEIDEINVILYFTEKLDESHYMLQISPVAQIPDDPALNVQIPFVVGSTRCHLKSSEALADALVEASEK